MQDQTLAWTPAVELASLIRSKKVSPVEVMEALFARIETFNDQVNAFAHLAPEQALAAARAAEAALASGKNSVLPAKYSV